MKNVFDHDNALAVYYVALYKNITKAAEKLNLSQPAVSRRIICAEERTGIRIFERKFHEMLPTPEGEKYIKVCEEIVHLGDAIIKDVHQSARKNEGIIRIYSTPSIANTWLPRILEGFCDLYPNIRLKIFSETKNLSITQSDILIYTFMPNAKNLKQIKIFDQAQGVFASQAYLEKYGEPKKIEELIDHKLLALDEEVYDNHININWLFKAGLGENSHRLAPSMTFDSNDGMVSAMLSGHGIASCGIHHMKMLSCRGIKRLFPYITSEKFGIYFTYNASVQDTTKYQTLLRFIQDKIADQRSFYDY
ncbi:MAG: LysR family transcriptional regulator [Alphaproteobacteria bacterium]|nr:MAG: LysR family transcriptional regulator [Alphaproteobacteria bacterium]